MNMKLGYYIMTNK